MWYWKEETLNIFHLWITSERSVAAVSLQADGWLWRVFPDSLVGNGLEEYLTGTQLNEWGFEHLISPNVYFPCLEGIETSLNDAKAIAECIIGKIFDKAIEAHDIELTERFPTLPAGLKQKPTTWQLTWSIVGPYLRGSWAWVKWSLIALTIIFIAHKLGLLDEWAAAMLMPMVLTFILFVLFLKK